MDIDYNLVQRAQMLLTLDHPLSQVKDILLREGYPENQVFELMDATEEALNYMVPPEYDENKIGIDIVRPGEKLRQRKPSVDILIDKRTGKLDLITPDQQETWRVATEVRKAIRQQRQRARKYLH
ncbi:Hypothetical protein DEACI_1818 [Acididesulfobacillus acetoxydans]|uniref:Uncharacterized protein n=1 Tax=Acididesulfobacillus acetoxydans TaxID=1561005 RepID=A0A8S0Y2T4_9FIRM|nr:hypothetical protein [Acididesulfobacillus acetoxydans]KLU61205.1 hypothetical protein CEB3_c24250 [Peptococcaceae bacterium CEB3]CAA7601165.1 Hypothetical protein DEACI_1818 [Acididesulfobacillus acetoxydans]CEJ08556.1 Hypothetical protein DEACI_3033 [Acididesulfobacillus acetoxydans]